MSFLEFSAWLWLVLVGVVLLGLLVAEAVINESPWAARVLLSVVTVLTVAALVVVVPW